MNPSLRFLAFVLTLFAVLIPVIAPAAIAPISEAELAAGASVIVTGEVTDFTVTSRANGALEIKLEITSVKKGDVKAGDTLRIVSWARALQKNGDRINGSQGLDPLPKKGDVVTAYLNPSKAKDGGKGDGSYAPLQPNGIKASPAPKEGARDGAKKEK